MFRAELPPLLSTYWYPYAYLCCPAAAAGAMTESGWPAPPGPFSKNSRREAKRVSSSKVTLRIGIVAGSHETALPKGSTWPALS